MLFNFTPMQMFGFVILVSGLLAWLAAGELLKAAGYGSRPTKRTPDAAKPWACECDWVNDANNVICVACGTPRR